MKPMVTVLVVWAAVAGNTIDAQSSPPVQAVDLSKGSSARDLLATLCKGSPSEPVCAVITDLSEDEAWVIVRDACRSDSGPNCRTFRQQQGGTLLYDVRADEWRAEWESQPYSLKFDVTGTPTLRIKPKNAKALKVLVTNISPLGYSARPGTPTESDLGIVAGLKTLLALAGTGIQALVQTAAYSPPASMPPFADVLNKPGVSAMAKGIGGQAAACPLQPPDVATLAAAVTGRVSRLWTVLAAMSRLEAALDTLEQSRAAYVRAVQNAEDGKPVTRAELARPDLTALDAAYQGFLAAAQSLRQETTNLTSCQPILTAYATLVGAPANARVIAEFADVVAATAGCAVMPLRTTLEANSTRLKQLAEDPSCTSQLKAIVELHRDATKPMVERLNNARQVEEKIWAAIDKVEAARKDVLVGGGVLDRQVLRGWRHTWNGLLLRELAVTRPNPELPWSKSQSHSIVIQADSPYAKDVTLAHGTEEKREYRLESATGQILGYGIGLIYTPLQESTWGAVTVPGTTDKVIAETKRETRAGDLAAFLSYRFLEHRPRQRHVAPTLDFGVGVTSDRPAFFLGLGVELWRAARVGFGWAPQRVTKLQHGQEPNQTLVSNGDEIKIRKRFDVSNWYISLTFALDSLSLFNKQ